MRARMKNNLIEIYNRLMPGDLKITGREIIDFLLSIQGKEVELIFTDGVAFEKNDDNFWLPDELWEKL